METDSDIAGYLLPGLNQKPTLLSTLDWWHTSWAGGPQVPFWRPLTSLGFWLEYHAFSSERVDRWMAVTAVCHLLFLALLVVFTQRLTQRWWLGVLAVLLFAGERALLIRCLPPDCRTVYAALDMAATPAAMALQNWKDQPEMWAGACILGAVILACDRRWVWALACAFAAVCFKESGWLVFPLSGVALWSRSQLRTVPHCVWVWAAVLILGLVVLRAWAGPAVFAGYHYGHNGHWWPRYFHQAGGCYLLFLTMTTSAGGVVLGTLLFVILRFWRRSLATGMVVAAAAIAIAAALQSRWCGGDFVAGLVCLLDWNEGLLCVVQSFLWLWLAFSLWKNRPYRRSAAALLLMDLLACAVVAAASQVTLHALYLALAFQSTLVSVPLALCFKRAVGLRSLPSTGL